MNRRGILELPMQYVIGAIVAGISIFLISMAAYNFWKENEINKVMKEVKKLVNEAELMYLTGEKETNITIEINLPSSIKKIVFGSNDERMSNHYYILMDWGTNKSFFAKNAKFKGKNGNVAILYEGRQRVVLEIIENGDKYVRVYKA